MTGVILNPARMMRTQSVQGRNRTLRQPPTEPVVPTDIS
ncbi:hypothetical protein U0070_021853 [Myodes glareolus]|uniref:Uncharacterized protein n=1 Tax=Myodes glareolus TaxID=447135 RepID=A0AAW0H5P5_MYOGA